MRQHGMIQCREQMMQCMITKVSDCQDGFVAKFFAIDGRINAVQAPIKIFSANERNREAKWNRPNCLFADNYLMASPSCTDSG